MSQLCRYQCLNGEGETTKSVYFCEDLCINDRPGARVLERLSHGKTGQGPMLLKALLCSPSAKWRDEVAFQRRRMPDG